MALEPELVSSAAVPREKAELAESISASGPSTTAERFPFMVTSEVTWGGKSDDTSRLIAEPFGSSTRMPDPWSTRFCRASRPKVPTRV